MENAGAMQMIWAYNAHVVLLVQDRRLHERL